VSNFQHAFDCVQDSLKSLKLMLNESKTKFMIFSNGRNNVPPTHRICTRSGTNIEQVPCYKYLGIWLDDRLSFKSHVLDLAKKVKIKLDSLYRIRSCFTFENRMEIVQSTILSVQKSKVKVKVALLSITLHVKTYKGIEKNVSHSPTVKHISAHAQQQIRQDIRSEE